MALVFSAFIVWKFLNYAKTLRALLHETRHDDLTGLMNRKGLRWRVEELAAGPESDREAVMLSVDLDGFKQINDRLGHVAGDEVLIKVAERLKGALRASDVVARIGGDEFIIVLKGASLEQGGRLAERIRRSISKEIETYKGPVSLTVSIGLIELDDGEPDTDVMHRLDKALYAAKGRGGDAVFVAGDGARVEDASEAPARASAALLAG